jgi:hypothetical protein
MEIQTKKKEVKNSYAHHHYFNIREKVMIFSIVLLKAFNKKKENRRK